MDNKEEAILLSLDIVTMLAKAYIEARQRKQDQLIIDLKAYDEKLKINKTAEEIYDEV